MEKVFKRNKTPAKVENIQMKVIVFKSSFHLKKIKNATCIDIQTLHKFNQATIHFIKHTKYNVAHSILIVIIKNLSYYNIGYYINFKEVENNYKLFSKKVKKLNYQSKLKIFQ